MFYTRADNVEEALEELTSTPLWESLSRINYDRLFRSIDQPQVTLFLEMFSQWQEDPQTQQIYEKFFSNQVALAIYPT